MNVLLRLLRAFCEASTGREMDMPDFLQVFFCCNPSSVASSLLMVCRNDHVLVLMLLSIPYLRPIPPQPPFLSVTRDHLR